MKKHIWLPLSIWFSVLLFLLELETSGFCGNNTDFANGRRNLL